MSGQTDRETDKQTDKQTDTLMANSQSGCDVTTIHVENGGLWLRVRVYDIA